MVKIFVGRLAPSVSSVQLRELFEKYGPVSDCDILRDYGFVHMPDEADAQHAISKLDKYELYGSRLSVELSTSRSMKSCQLTVRNLPNGVSSQDLHTLFKKYGTVTLCKINSDNATVHMRFPSMATNAVRNLSGETYHGNVLSVEFTNNVSKPVTYLKNQIKLNGSIESAKTNGGASLEPKKPIITMASTPKQSAWNRNILTINKASNEQCAVDPVVSPTNGFETTTALDVREARQLKIKQGLEFLQSSTPWNSMSESYESFLKRLKGMLLEEGPKLFREGHVEEGITQINEAINICSYMKSEGIKSHVELLDRLFMERAAMYLASGNSTGALEDAEKAFIVSNETNQKALRLKAQLLVECGKRREALLLMLTFQQNHSFDVESTNLCKIFKQSMGLRDDNVNPSTTTKGTIGDGRNRTFQHPTAFSKPDIQNSFGLNQSQWSNVNGNGDNSNAFIRPYSNFGEETGLPRIDALYQNHSYPQQGSRFQTYFNRGDNGNSALLYNSVPSYTVNTNPRYGSASTSNTNRLYSSSSFQSPSSESLFSTDLYSFANQTNGFAREASTQLPIGFQRTDATYPSVVPHSWQGKTYLNKVGSETNVDDQIDKEFVQAIKKELSIETMNNVASYSLPTPSWPNNHEHSKGYSHFNSPVTTPSYNHFPTKDSKLGFTGSLLGPAMPHTHSTSSTNNVPQLSQVPVVSHPEPQVSTVNSESEMLEVSDTLSDILKNPLHETHEFKLGCTECVIRTGPRVLDFRHDESICHTCSKNILLCRCCGEKDWVKIRPRPQPQSKAQLYDGPYYICKDLMSGQDCTYPAVCTFAYSQEEITVWTLERKGMLNRAWLCKSMDMTFVNNLSLVEVILSKHGGCFDFLCKACFQNKPRIISKFSSVTGNCTNASTSHLNIPEFQQLTHVIRDETVKYTEIRDPSQQTILCRHAMRFQCSRGDECHFAHSLVERDAWVIMDKEGFFPSDIVKQSQEHTNKQTTTNSNADATFLLSGGKTLPQFRWKVKFICSLCHKNGQINEATKDLKYCTARAQHSWTTNKKIMLVFTAKNAWVPVRDLPYLKNKNLPVRFELCENYRKQKKCTFSGKCNFAHSQEEMDLWVYLRENQLKDLEELYDAFAKEQLAKQTSRSNTQGTSASSILLPTDIFSQSAYHCWLCDKECNGKRQWEKHCLSENHRWRAISDSDGHWRFRKPSGNYKLCERHEKKVCEFDLLPASENACSYAHSQEELEEWINRRQYVINRIKKAKDDRLIDNSIDMDNLISHSSRA